VHGLPKQGFICLAGGKIIYSRQLIACFENIYVTPVNFWAGLWQAFQHDSGRHLFRRLIDVRLPSLFCGGPDSSTKTIISTDAGKS
jgi:non-ribosomal peptide synthetase component F